jgi:hypothetical protein
VGRGRGSFSRQVGLVFAHPNPDPQMSFSHIDHRSCSNFTHPEPPHPRGGVVRRNLIPRRGFFCLDYFQDEGLVPPLLGSGDRSMSISAGV